MNNSELQIRHFDALKKKYQVGQHRNAASDSFLYLILRKVDLDIRVTDLEFQWLAENRFFGTIEIISFYQYQKEEKNRLENDFLKLRTKYRIPEELVLPIDSPIYSILWKLDAGHIFTDSDLKLLNDCGCIGTINLIQDILNFLKLKAKYKANKNLSPLPEEPLYSILRKLDTKSQLSDSEADWLLEYDFGETLEIHWQQENTRKAELEFLDLKVRYHVDSYSNNSITSRLYIILKKFENKELLDLKDKEWLKKKKIHHLVQLEESRRGEIFFSKLRERYKAIQHPDLEPFGKLFKILAKILFCDQSPGELLFEVIDLPDIYKSNLGEKDINWLINEGLTETTKIAQRVHFKSLQSKYKILGQLPIDPFYEIMLKLERSERLDPKQVVQLIEEGHLSPQGKIAIAYHTLEAIFYEEEHKRTGNKWNLASASSHWRKADKPQKSLDITENVPWEKVKKSDLKSALLVTRGAACRDLSQLDEAEKCATQAMTSHPNSHQPYTLLGAICYDRGEYTAGDNWFKQAIERGAKDTDDEIKRIVRMAKDKDKRKEVVEYLLNKDRTHYSWAKSYLS